MMKLLAKIFFPPDKNGHCKIQSIQSLARGSNGRTLLLGFLICLRVSPVRNMSSSLLILTWFDSIIPVAWDKIPANLGVKMYPNPRQKSGKTRSGNSWNFRDHFPTTVSYPAHCLKGAGLKFLMGLVHKMSISWYVLWSCKLSSALDNLL